MFRKTSQMKSFVKIKWQNYSVVYWCRYFNAIRENKILAKITEFIVPLLYNVSIKIESHCDIEINGALPTDSHN